MQKKVINPTLKLICLLVIMSQVSCWQNEKSEQLADIRPSISSNLVAYEELLKALPSNDLTGGFEEIKKNHPHFSDLYVNRLVAAETNDQLLEELSLIHSDTSYLQLYDEVKNTFGDLSDIKPEIDQALENYLEVFSLPSSRLPNVYTFVSGFAYQAFVFDDGGRNGIGLGLDMFLGEEFPYQRIHPQNPSFSQYLVRTYNKEHIVRKMIEVLVEDQLAPPQESNFLSFILWGGKKLYLIDRILDFKPDTIVTEYTQEQLSWCKNNEAEIWKFFFEKDLFYETDIRKFNKLIVPAPTSPGMPSESPGQTGNFIGWQIVQNFMSKYPSTSVLDLIRFEDAQKFLDLSKYKPAR